MNIIRRARGAELPKRMQKIFFSCDAGNADGRSALISDLLSMDAGMDCVVSYLAIPGEDIDENALKDELQENQALVLWVTDELLSAVAGSAFPIEYRIAEELHIPILPIANDGSLFPRFTEIAGAIHGIAMNDAEYRTQLKAQLESFLASEEVIRQIQERAFTAEVFLSYRKKDIKDARRFMKAFHDLEKFDAISIWYDGFLTAGRNFDYEIRDSITNCGAFVLLVTPNLATEGNYVQTAEYPFARQMNKPVVPAATIPTDQARFAALFPGAGLAVSVDNSAALRTVFLEKLDESAYKWQMDSERAYLLGIAYVKGLGVERDFDRGMRLLKKAADGSDLSALRAAQQLAGLYQNGIGTGISYDEAYRWWKRVADLAERILGTACTDTAAVYTNIAEVCRARGNYSEALEWYRKDLGISEHLQSNKHNGIAKTYNNIAAVYSNLGNYQQALEWNRKALVIKAALPEDDISAAITYNNTGVVSYQQGDYAQALAWYRKALAIRESALGPDHPDTASSYNNIAGAYRAEGSYSEALAWYEKALTVCENVFGEEHLNTATVYNNIGAVYYNQGDDAQALVWYLKALNVREKVLGTEHPETAQTYSNIGVVYNAQGDHRRALMWHGKALAACEKTVGRAHPDTAGTLYNIAAAYEALRDYPSAAVWYQRSWEIRERVFGADHSFTVEARQNLVRIRFLLGGIK